MNGFVCSKQIDIEGPDICAHGLLDALVSGVKHYLTAVKAAGTTVGRKVAAKMRELPVNDFMTANGEIREDGRMLRDRLSLGRSPRENGIS